MYLISGESFSALCTAGALPDCGAVSITPDPTSTISVEVLFRIALSVSLPAPRLINLLPLMPNFTFSKQDILNTDLHHDPAGRSTSYRIDTTTGFRGRKTTTLVPTGRSSSHRIPAAIHWRERTFEMGGVKHDWSTLKHNTGGIFSSSREWRWSRKSYTVKFHHAIWTASLTSSPHTTRATFSPYKSHWFSPNESGQISIPVDVSDEDTAFLILVMIYSETKRLDSARSSDTAASSSADASAAAC